MAAPHASGVAAIVIGANGGRMPPAQVEAALRQAADGLGKPGNDDGAGARQRRERGPVTRVVQ
jgi:lantibiotic leader peptide-processing serine protease